MVVTFDQAHAMLPHLGAGAGQGMEDAYLLAKLLGRLDTNSTGEEIEVSLCPLQYISETILTTLLCSPPCNRTPRPENHEHSKSGKEV